MQSFVVKRSCIIVPNYSDLKKLIIRKIQDSLDAENYRITKTLRTVGKPFWWSCLKVDVTNIFVSCPPCQRN
jgi:hypothetical protein